MPRRNGDPTAAELERDEAQVRAQMAAYAALNLPVQTEAIDAALRGDGEHEAPIFAAVASPVEREYPAQGDVEAVAGAAAAMADERDARGLTDADTEAWRREALMDQARQITQDIPARLLFHTTIRPARIVVEGIDPNNPLHAERLRELTLALRSRYGDDSEVISQRFENTPADVRIVDTRDDPNAVRNLIAGVDLARGNAVSVVTMQDDEGNHHVLGTMESAQLTLIPEHRAEPVQMRINTEACLVAASTPIPTDDLVASIRAFGIIQPIAVRIQDGDQYEVIEGRRRVLAARIAGVGLVPALVFPSSTPNHVVHSMTLAGNLVRRPNPLAELEAIEALVQAGYNERMIARELRLSRQTLDARLRLARLCPPLREALADGRLSPTVAEQAARLHGAQQGRLVILLLSRAGVAGQRQGITADDVRTVRQARQAQVASALPQALFDTPRATRPSEAGVDPLQRLAEARQENADAEPVRMVINELPSGGTRYAFMMEHVGDEAHIAIGNGAGADTVRIVTEEFRNGMRPAIYVNDDRVSFHVPADAQVAFNEYGVAIINGARYVSEVESMRDHNQQLETLRTDLAHEQAEERSLLVTQRDNARAALSEAQESIRRLNDQLRGTSRDGPIAVQIDDVRVEVRGIRYLREAEAVQIIDDTHINYDGNLWLRGDEAERVHMQSNEAVDNITQARVTELEHERDAMRAELEGLRDTVRAVASDTQTPARESWDSTYRSISRSLDLVPVGADEQSERLYLALSDVRDQIRPLAERETAQAVRAPATPDVRPPVADVAFHGERIEVRPANAPARVTTVGERLRAVPVDGLAQRVMARTRADAPVETPIWNETNIFIRDRYRAFDAEGPRSRRRYFIRYVDTAGRIRKRFVTERAWREALALEVARRIATNA